MNQTLEDRLIDLMREKKMSKSELARNLGISRQAVYSWFLSSDNKRSMNDKTLEKIARLFGVSDYWLRYGINDKVKMNNLATICDCASVNGTLAYINEVKEDVLLKLRQKHFIDINKLKFVKVHDDAMYPTFHEGDRFLIDTSIGQNVTEDGYYLIVTNDRLSVRHISKDAFSHRYLLSCGNASYEDQLLREAAFHEIVQEVYRIYLVQREL